MESPSRPPNPRRPAVRWPPERPISGPGPADTRARYRPFLRRPETEGHAGRRNVVGFFRRILFLSWRLLVYINELVGVEYYVSQLRQRRESAGLPGRNSAVLQEFHGLPQLFVACVPAERDSIKQLYLRRLVASGLFLDALGEMLRLQQVSFVIEQGQSLGRHRRHLAPFA